MNNNKNSYGKSGGLIKWPGADVQMLDVSSLSEYGNNSRTHDIEQIAQIAASIEAFGFTNPILIDEHNTILAGHGRLLAARRLGLTQVPCMRAEGWSEAQKKAYVIADNKLALNAGWDIPLLKEELSSLNDFGFDLNLTGFDGGELYSLFAEKEPVTLDQPTKTLCPHCGGELAG